jgi:hypothetical protein
VSCPVWLVLCLVVATLYRTPEGRAPVFQV